MIDRAIAARRVARELTRDSYSTGKNYQIRVARKGLRFCDSKNLLKIALRFRLASLSFFRLVKPKVPKLNSVSSFVASGRKKKRVAGAIEIKYELTEKLIR